MTYYLRKFKITSILLVIFLFSASLDAKVTIDKNKLIGNIIKNALESYHYVGLKIDDSVSQKAFLEYIKKIDYAKQFLLKSDVAKLEKFKLDLDDEMVSGDVKLVEETMKIMKNRVKKIDGYRKDFFKKGFDFNKKEYLELDPEKRDFVKTESEQKEAWRMTTKQAVLSRYLDLLEEQKNPDADKDKSSSKKKKNLPKGSKKLTDAEIIKMANEQIDKKYKHYFSRLLKEESDDYLEKFYNSIAQIYDPHTTYLPPKKKEDFDIDISGSLEGIGAVLQEDGPYIKVVSIVPGGAAWRQKELEVEDVILSVAQEKDKEPVSLVDMRVDDAVRYIRGPKGTIVSLGVKKVDGARKVIKITRDVVQIGASFAKSSILQHKNLDVKVGYIYVPKFYRDFEDNARNCSDDVRKEIIALRKKGIDAIILDLRNNGGGALEDARIMSGLFFDQGPVVQIRNHKGGVEVLKDTDPTIEYDGPLIVMTNRFSASASEIVAAALQDYDRAIVVGGEFTHGKGTVQAVVNLNQAPLLSMFGPTMGALKVTIQKFYRVNGSSTQYKGVTPDIIIPDALGYAKNREQDLDYSLKWDQVEPQPFHTWKKYSLDKSLLKARSAQRVAKNERLRKISESVEYLVKRRDETKVPLSLAEVKAREVENDKMLKKLKLDEVNKDIVVSNFEESLQVVKDMSGGDKEQWKKDFDQRKEEWVEGLQKDPGLEEALFIASDMVGVINGKKLSMINNGQNERAH